LLSITNTYHAVYKWFDSLHEKNHRVLGYVIMPNDIHVLLYFPEIPRSINSIIGNPKRFMGYEIIKRLEVDRNFELLEDLYQSVKKAERKKEQRHKVFADSFDVK